MDTDRFDSLTRLFSSAAASRRRLLKNLAGSTLGGLTLALGFTDARANHYGCRHVGRPCRQDGQCCSSRCRGPSGNETCRAHHEGTCTAVKDACLTGTRGCGGGTCYCYRTTGGANFCSSADGPCMACTTDRECELALGVPGSACVAYDHAGCAGVCSGATTACLLPCAA